MNLLRKLELGGGAIAAVIAIFVGIVYLRLDQAGAERLGQEFPVSSVVVFSVLYLLPGLLILVGSYVHSVKAKQLGQFLLIIASVVNVGMFVFFLLSPVPVPYGRLDLFWLYFLSAALAICTSIISVFVQRQRSVTRF